MTRPDPSWRTLIAATNAVSLAGILGAMYMIYGLLLPTWFAMVGWKLFRLGRANGSAIPRVGVR
ncbi:hypothetical protein [Tessaracoccus sp. Z1128]